MKTLIKKLLLGAFLPGLLLIAILATAGAFRLLPAIEPALVALPLLALLVTGAVLVGIERCQRRIKELEDSADVNSKCWIGEINLHNRTKVKLDESEAARRRQASRIRMLEAELEGHSRTTAHLRDQLRAAQEERDMLLGLAELSATQRDFWRQHAKAQQESIAARTAALAGIADALKDPQA